MYFVEYVPTLLQHIKNTHKTMLKETDLSNVKLLNKVSLSDCTKCTKCTCTWFIALKNDKFFSA